MAKKNVVKKNKQKNIEKSPRSAYALKKKNKTVLSVPASRASSFMLAGPVAKQSAFV